MFKRWNEGSEHGLINSTFKKPGNMYDRNLAPPSPFQSAIICLSRSLSARRTHAQSSTGTALPSSRLSNRWIRLMSSGSKRPSVGPLEVAGGDGFCMS